MCADLHCVQEDRVRVHFRAWLRSKRQTSTMIPATHGALRCGAAKAALRCTDAVCAWMSAAVSIGPHRRRDGSIVTHPNSWMHDSPISACSDNSGDVACSRKRSPAAAVQSTRTFHVTSGPRPQASAWAWAGCSDSCPFQRSAAIPTAQYISRAQAARLQQRLAHSGKRSATFACLATHLISCDMGTLGTARSV